MRVLMLVSEAPPIKSGIARVAGQLTDGLRERGLKVDVLSANEIPRWTFKEFRFSSLAFHWPAIQQQLADYDILHIHGTVPTFSDVGLLLGRLGRHRAHSRLGLVYTHHSDIDISGLGVPVALYNRLHYQMVRLADHLVASTPSYAMQLEAHARPGRVSAVGFGVDAERFQALGPKAPRFTVLFVGQLRPYKGVDVLLRAWQHVANADLHIAGAGHEQANLQALARRLGLNSVYFHGALSDKEIAGLYASAHVLVLPSTTRAEAFGLVLLEGMAAGCVPVASALPGVSDVVGTSGYTFPVGDSAALADLLCRLRDDPGMREEMGARASARAVAAGWDYTIDSYMGIYRQVHLGRLLEVATGDAPPTPHVLGTWIDRVARSAGADRASLMLTTPNGRQLGIAASVGLPRDIASQTRLPMGQRMAGFVAQTGRSLLVRPRAMPALARLYRRDPRLTSALILPVGRQGHTIGVLNLARGDQRLPFTPTDQRWLEQLMVQVTPLLRRYQLPPVRPATTAGQEDDIGSTPIRSAQPGTRERAAPVNADSRYNLPDVGPVHANDVA